MLGLENVRGRLEGLRLCLQLLLKPQKLGRVAGCRVDTTEPPNEVAEHTACSRGHNVSCYADRGTNKTAKCTGRFGTLCILKYLVQRVVHRVRRRIVIADRVHNELSNEAAVMLLPANVFLFGSREGQIYDLQGAPIGVQRRHSPRFRWRRTCLDDCLQLTGSFIHLLKESMSFTRIQFLKR
jgi:hypothetical protein